MSHEELNGVVTGALDVKIDRRAGGHVIRPVVQGRVIGGDRALNTIMVQPPAGRAVTVQLTRHHLVAYTRAADTVAVAA